MTKKGGVAGLCGDGGCQDVVERMTEGEGRRTGGRTGRPTGRVERAEAKKERAIRGTGRPLVFRGAGCEGGGSLATAPGMPENKIRSFPFRVAQAPVRCVVRQLSAGERTSLLRRPGGSRRRSLFIPGPARPVVESVVVRRPPASDKRADEAKRQHPHDR